MREQVKVVEVSDQVYSRIAREVRSKLINQFLLLTLIPMGCILAGMMVLYVSTQNKIDDATERIAQTTDSLVESGQNAVDEAREAAEGARTAAEDTRDAIQAFTIEFSGCDDDLGRIECLLQAARDDE